MSVRGRAWGTAADGARLRHRECLAALQANSPDAHVFCLLHKMDLVEAPRRRSVYASRVEELRKKSQGSTIHCFATSIMDETIYKVRRSRAGRETLGVELCFGC